MLCLVLASSLPDDRAHETVTPVPQFKGRTEDEVLDSIVNLTPASLPDSMSPEARDFLAHW